MTEIAIYKFDGQHIIDEFQSLINPEMSIPPYVQKLTGITDSMTAKAPRFSKMADFIWEFINDTTIVAHNIKFDYSFLQMEFKKTGYHLRSNRLCTLELSKLLIPGIGAYGLSNLCKELSINNNERHRAKGDALATLELFKLLRKRDQKDVIAKKLRRA